MTTHKLVPVTKEQALKALEDMDDFAGMAVSVNAFGARETLRRFIEQAAPAPSGEAVYHLEVARTMAHLHDANGYTGGSFHYKSHLDKERAHAIVDRLNAHPPAERDAEPGRRQ